MKENMRKSHPKKEAFLINYPTFMRISKTATAIGIDRTTIHNWLNKDTVFNNAFIAIKKELDRELLERHEASLNEMVFDPKTPAMVRFLGHCFRMKALAPEKYREKPLIDKAVIGDIVIKWETMPAYADRLTLEMPQQAALGAKEAVNTIESDV